jgi:hypothetical protein
MYSVVFILYPNTTLEMQILFQNAIRLGGLVALCSFFIKEDWGGSSRMSPETGFC